MKNENKFEKYKKENRPKAEPKQSTSVFLYVRQLKLAKDKNLNLSEILRDLFDKFLKG